MVPVELYRTLLNERVDEQYVFLREPESGRILSICIGMFEAAALDRAIHGRSAQRPLTHDLILGVIDGLGATLARVEIVDRRDETYFARLVLGAGADERYVDARPSDAITLAAKRGIPILVASHVLDGAPPPPV